MTNTPRREPSHPHGWLGYVIADHRRVANAVRLARWAVLAITIIAAAVVVIALSSPLTAVALLTMATVAGGSTIGRRRRRRSVNIDSSIPPPAP